MAPKSTAPKFSEPASEPYFKVFEDDIQLQTPQRSTLPVPSVVYNDHNENLDPSYIHRSKATFKFVNKSAMENDSTTPVKRTPLADVTEDVVSRPRSLSSALAEIARLENKLQAYKDDNQTLKDKNRELKGEIVAYQDALYQADVDAGYL